MIRDKSPKWWPGNVTTERMAQSADKNGDSYPHLHLNYNC